MKRKLLSIISIAILATMFTSCDESDDITPTVLGDVYVKVKTISDKTQYALYAYTYANVAIKSASITQPSDEVITLKVVENQTNVFSNFTNTDELYSDVIPTKGDYAFSVQTTDDVDFNIIDVLSDDIASVPVISSATLVDSEITVEWAEATNVDYYILRFVDVDNKEIFTTDYLPTTTLTKTITSDIEGWSTNKSMDDAVKVLVMALKFENSDAPGSYDLQSIAEGYKDIEKL